MIKSSTKNNFKILYKTIMMTIIIGFFYLRAFLLIIPTFKIEEGLLGFEVFMIVIIAIGLISFFKINQVFQEATIKEVLKGVENMEYTIIEEMIIIKKNSVIEKIAFAEVNNISKVNNYFRISTKYTEYIVPINYKDDDILESIL